MQRSVGCGALPSTIVPSRMSKRLYVGNLPYDADEDGIRAVFTENGGRVERVHIPLDRETQRPRGFAFVEMASEADAQKALEALNGASFGSRTMRVSEAEERRASGSHAGGARGGHGGSRGGVGSGGARGAEHGDVGRAGGSSDPVDRARENRERRFGPDARPSRERGRGRKGRGVHGRRRHEDAGEDRGRRGGSRFDDYED